MKRCTVVYALPDAHWIWTVELPPEATVADALAAARARAATVPQVPWETATVGIFGQISARDVVFADGDRIEIYRPLAADPRASRRARVERDRKRRGSGA
ncbi:MAG: Persistence and stress-resistance antitoxin PasI [Steroidobacteraceae bacterium]|nr:Persistence and stress-resistance antitoxin PasI [Steroidobacteraceae bacterium]